MDTEGLLIKLNWKYRRAGNQFVLDCPFCKKEKHFYINAESGLWDCKKCQNTGNLYQLRLEFDQDLIKTSYRPKINYIKTPEIKKVKKNYLNAVRKISNEVIEKLKIVFESYKVGFVYHDQKNKPYLIKWRSTKKKEFYSEPNAPIYFPYGIEQLNHDKNHCIICEGEIDVLSWMTYGFDNVVGIPGAGSFKGEWIKIFQNFQEIYLSFDMDEAGQIGAEKIIEKLINYCVIKKIHLPKKDINECLMAEIDVKEIVKSFANAKTYTSKEIIHVKNILIKKPTKADLGVETPWEKFNKMSRLRPEELSVYTGHTKHGKTAFVTCMIYKLLEENIPVLFGSFEITIQAMKKKLFGLMTGQNYYNSTITQKQLDEANNKFESLPLYFFNHYGAINLDKLEAIISYSDKFFDTKFVVLDNLSYMISPGVSNKVEKIGETLRKIKALTLNQKNHIIVICHPAKTTSENEISEFTLRGSAEIAQICDNLYIVRADKETNETEIELRLARHELAQTGKVTFSIKPLTGEYWEKYV